MLNESIYKKLLENLRPVTSHEFEQNLLNLKKQGYDLPEVSYKNVVISQEKADSILEKLSINKTSLFYKIMKEISFFPIGQGDELDTLTEVYYYNYRSIWDDEFEKFSDRFLQLCSSEGEGSYFYEISTDYVYDVDWDYMDHLVTGDLKPNWKSYQEFLEWYYS